MTTPPPAPATSDNDTPSLLRRIWRRIILQNVAPEIDPLRTLAVTIAALATAVISYESLFNLALKVLHLHMVSASLFPLAFDAVVFGATRVWLHPRLSDGTRRYAAWVATATIVASIAGNAVWHVADGFTRRVDMQQMVVVIVFSSLIPLVLALVIHMGSLIRRDRRQREEKEAGRQGRQQAKTVTVSAAVAEPAVAHLEATGTDGASSATVTDITAPRDRIREAISRHLAANRTVGGRGADVSWAAIDAEAGTNTYAKKIGPAIVAELQEEVSSDGQ